MNENFTDQIIVRQYLLETLKDDEIVRLIEREKTLDDKFAEQISIAEDDLITNFLDGKLTVSEVRSFKNSFLDEPHRREKLNNFKELRKFNLEQKDKQGKTSEKKYSVNFPRFTSPVLVRVAAGILIVLGIGLIVWRTAFYETEVDKGLKQMQAAFRGLRPLESRSTIDLEYAPFKIIRGGDVLPTDEKSLDRAERIFLDAAENPKDARAHHALGLLFLQKRQFDKALGEFKTALDITPENPQLNSDTGAALLEKAKLAETSENYDQSAENLFRAYEAVNRALKFKNDLPEALFNKGLILHKMRLPNQERAAWQTYLENDRASGWKIEVRKNLETLQSQENPPKDKTQILQDFLEAFRRGDDQRAFQIASQTKELITGVMVQQQIAEKFLEADLQNRTDEKDEFLAALVYLGKIEKQNTGDPFFEKLADYYSSANAAQKQKLFAAHQKLKQSYALILDQKFNEATGVLNESRQLFADAGNRWEIYLADYQKAYCQTQLGDSAASNRILLQAIGEFDEKNYWLQALFYGWLGSNFSGEGEFSQGIAYEQKSLETAEKISDSYNIQRALTQLGFEYRRIGNYSETLGYGFRGLSGDGLYYYPPRQKFRNLQFFAQTSIEAGYFDAALAYADENLDLVENNLKDKWLTHTLRVQLGTIYGDTGEFENALTEFEKSIEIVKDFSDEVKVKQLTARSYLSMANMFRQKGDCDAALENYDRTLSIYQTLEFSANIYEAEKGKLLCYIAQKNEAEVREKMPLILESFDEYRRKLKEGDRTAFFNTEQNIYDAAIDFSFTNLKNQEEAFNYSENSRSRTLLGLMHGGEQRQTLSLAEVRGKMPEQAQIIYYTVLPDKILIWHITKSKISTAEKIIAQPELARLTDEYRKNLTGKFDAEINFDLSHKLYELLIAPVKENLEKDSVICFIADKQLFQIPFASLISPQTNKFLIEDHAVLLAPSATVFIEQSETARRKNISGEETILSIGNPDFSVKENPALAALPSAEKEAKNVAEIYPLKLIYTDKQAVKAQIIKGFARADIVQFAGHYVPNFKSPSLSKFLLAADESEQTPDDLSVGEIMQTRLPHTKLIVLSACETGVEKFYNGEGMIGAARAFLASDVPLVVASQWSVDSDATGELMLKFHTYRKRGNLKTVEALRRAQIDMLRDEKSRFQKPFYWSGFLPIGGFADY